MVLDAAFSLLNRDLILKLGDSRDFHSLITVSENISYTIIIIFIISYSDPLRNENERFSVFEQQQKPFLSHNVVVYGDDAVCNQSPADEPARLKRLKYQHSNWPQKPRLSGSQTATSLHRNRDTEQHRRLSLTEGS